MDKLNALRTFVEVARCGSFVGAAEQLQQSTSTTSRLLRELEQDLGLALLLRTTRKVSLTDAGHRYFERCRSIIASIDDLSVSAQHEAGEPSGLLHLAAGAHFARRRLAPLLPGFLQRYPKVRLHMHLDERPTDIVAQGIDLAIRLSSAERDSGLVSRRIGRGQVWLVASPGFIRRHGSPSQIEEISRFPCLVDTVPAFKNRWPLGQTIPVEGPIAANDGELIAAMAQADFGLTLLPDFFVADAVADGRLVRLLDDQFEFNLDIRAVFPGRSQITAPARAFADYLSEHLLC